MSVLAMVMVQEALATRPEEVGMVIRDPARLFKTISALRLSKQQFCDMFLQSQKQYIQLTVLPGLRLLPDELMLRELVQRWSVHKNSDRWLGNLFDYLDTQHLENWQPPIPLGQFGITCFKDLIYERIKGQVKDAVLVLVFKEREGQNIDRALLKNVLDIFVQMGGDCYDNDVQMEVDYYDRDFEKFLLDDTAKYYSVKAGDWVRENSYFAYMVKVEDSLKQERKRVKHYLKASTGHKLLEEVQKVLGLFRKQLLEMEQTKCFALLHDNKVHELSNMCADFLKSYHGSDIMHMIKMYLTNEITDLVKQAEDSASNTKVILRKIIELLDKYEDYAKKFFQDRWIFKNMIKQAVNIAFSKGVSCNSGEFLATFCDKILKKGCSEKLSNLAIEDATKKVVRLVACISGRNTFAEDYRLKLGRRLMFNETNREHEKIMLANLKEQLGRQYTSRMDHMLTDLSIGSPRLIKNQEFGIEFDVMVSFQELPLTLLKGECSIQIPEDLVSCHGFDLAQVASQTGFCPPRLYAKTLPPEMLQCLEDLEKSCQEYTCKKVPDEYKDLMNHMKVSRTWLYFLKTCHMNVKFEAETKELVVTAYQAALLNLFNGADRLSCDEVVKQLNLPCDVVACLLYSVSCGAYKILNKQPANTTICTSDFFEVNLNFTDSREMIKIPIPPNDIKMKGHGKAEVRDWKYQIDASIVRIMKERKVMGHQALVRECIEDLICRWKCKVDIKAIMEQVDIKAVKKRIENLMEREYMERDQHNMNIYRYLP